ncbi:MAG: hypothetical protein JWP65_3804 [Ramlibacter sp.]|jgi:hypothetical protein|uniref:PhaM family polyhydroxyalkanoate granule multifunctional regulatory protein n=1 Tax=Ramlibacter sp. TaxID=1917967 RepID=UPI0026230959|nr:PhaM family polyhydroxyalkanoate granule multifunctional regulatory protein [Ramlibacter sp.]MDB5753383.1 hypothetical protein [Ramlibacter sp.]
MSANPDFGFGKFVPGFDFLQNLAKGTAQATPQMGALSSWVAPTLNVEELDKRICELKAVAFWLDQNGKALAATIQALEVQKMTLATLKGMNVNMSEMAEAMKARTAEAVGGMQKMTQAAAGAARPAAKKAAAANGDAAAGGPVDPLQWWGALTQQFQQIAASALQDVAQAVPPEAQRPAETVTAGVPTGKSAAGTPAPRKAAARKSAPRKASPRP